MPSDHLPVAIVVESTLTAAQRDAVLALVDAAESVDGASALSEAFRLALSGSTAQHLLAYAGDLLVGYAQRADVSADDSAAELVVHPDHRRRGVGAALLGRLPGAVHLWAHSSGSATTGFIAASGLQVVRRLFVLRRPLGAEAGGDAALPA
ncbi:MAG TPA: GNAT family N-acetyltransferase, partial [Dermatophilaceae bacterium]|nr:GNAT family N-acetyltransferase [Dermatophilaceae bacterium]